MGRIEELQKKLEDAREAYNKVDAEQLSFISDETAKIKAEAERRFGEDLKKYGNEVFDLEGELRALVQEQRVAKSENSLPFPEGTILVRCEEKDIPWNHETATLRRMKRGVLQVFRAGDEMRETCSKYVQREPVGNVIVRMLKKDGSEGKIFVDYGTTKECWSKAD